MVVLCIRKDRRSTMAWNPQSLIKAAEAAGIDYEVDETWLKVDPYGKSFQPVGVVWHHTACGTYSKGDAPSLGYCRNPGVYAGESRACQIVVGRSGKFYIIAGSGAYHAGTGGPMKVNGTNIPKDLGNRYLIGIEIEASSTSKLNKKNQTTPKSGLNPIQLEAVAKFCAALFDQLNWSTEAAIRHKDWAPGRKIDVGIPLETIRSEVNKYRKKSPSIPKPTTPVVTPVATPTVRLSDLRLGQRSNSAIIVKGALNKEFKRSNLPLRDLWGKSATGIYKKWQKVNGYYGKDADGHPGRATLIALGKKHGFKVV
jgi:hypothetical protein